MLDIAVGYARSRTELKAVLGKHFEGVLSIEDHIVYNGYSVNRQQKCLAYSQQYFKSTSKTRAKTAAKHWPSLY